MYQRERAPRDDEKSSRRTTPSAPETVVQRKLRVGSAADPTEREADRMADHVMRFLAGVDGPPGLAAGQPDLATTRIARAVRAPADVGPDGGGLSAELEGRIRRTAGGGAPLDAATRTTMEHAFEADLGAVRIHPNSPIAPRIGADAFTAGSDIHFAPGSYQPSTRAGQWLLGHELTHVVQQGGAKVRRRRADQHRGGTSVSEFAGTGGIVQRHSSWEHMLIGDLDPVSLAKVGAAYDVTAAGKVDLGFTVNGQDVEVDRADVLHVIQQEVDRLKDFQNNPPQFTDYKGVAGKTAALKQKDPTWDVELVAVPNASGTTFLVTYGELNTLADFFGSVEEMKAMDESFVDKLIRGVRQSTMRELVKVYTAAAGLQSDLGSKKVSSKVPGLKSAEEKAEEQLGLDSTSFKSASGKDDAIALGGVAAELKLMGILKHGTAKPVVGKDPSTDYSSTLARNACHFPPESWHAWADYHTKARALARDAYDMQQKLAADKAKRVAPSGIVSPLTDFAPADARAEERIATKANEAMVNNGFGDHYLQDSYAAGHLINKTLIMQWYVQWLDGNPGAWDAHRDKNWRTTQQTAYNQPGLTDESQYTKTDVGKTRTIRGQQGVTSARNPQSVENVQGDWKVKAEALGLEVPTAVMTGDSHELLVAWQYLCVRAKLDPRPRVQTVKSLRALGATKRLSATKVDAALEQLYLAGAIHFTKYSTSDPTQEHDIQPSDKLSLRDDYVPSSETKLTQVLQTPGKKGYEDLALGVAYNDYLEFMNSAFLQKATNFLHDHYCVNGLDVKTGDGWPVFKVYGDDHMFRQNASMGLAHSGVTAHMSRNSIMQVIQKGAEDPGHSTQDILKRLPEKVQLDDASVVSLADWHKGALRTECEKSIFPSMSNAGKNQVFNKLAPGIGGSLGQITKDKPPHGNDVF
jgi:hypothetical protein